MAEDNENRILEAMARVNALEEKLKSGSFNPEEMARDFGEIQKKYAGMTVGVQFRMDMPVYLLWIARRAALERYRTELEEKSESLEGTHTIDTLLTSLVGRGLMSEQKAPIKGLIKMLQSMIGEDEDDDKDD